MNKFSLIFEYVRIFQNFLAFENTGREKFEVVTVKLLVQLPGNLLNVIKNLVTKTLKIRKVWFIFQNFEKHFHKRKKFFLIFTDFEESTNSFGPKVIGYLIIEKSFFYQFFNTFYIYFFHFLKIFVVSRCTELLQFFEFQRIVKSTYRTLRKCQKINVF